MKNKKRTITETIGHLSPYEMNMPLGDLKDKIVNLIALHGKDAKVSWDSYYRYPYESEPSPRFDITVQREENDEEHNRRLAKETSDQKIRTDRDLAEYLRLQKQFGNK